MFDCYELGPAPERIPGDGVTDPSPDADDTATISAGTLRVPGGGFADPPRNDIGFPGGPMGPPTDDRGLWTDPVPLP